MRSIGDVMTRGVVSVSARTPARLAKRIAADVRIRHLLVKGNNDRLAGVLCLCDLRSITEDDPVERCMATRVVTIPPGETLERTAAILRERRVGCLPVTSSRGLHGIVTRGDLTRLGFSDEALGIIRCASCGYSHNVVAPFGTPDVGFCLFCRERSVLPEEDTELGGG